MSTSDQNNSTGWFERKRRERGRRALERQLEFQERKAKAVGEAEDHLMRTNFLRSQMVRQRLEQIQPIDEDARVIEVGSGSHGLIFGFANKFRVGIDPLAVECKRLFPDLQASAQTVAAIGEELPFEDASFDVVMSDNVIDHAERPLEIVDELVRILKPGGLLYFTVNVHHPFYDLASRAHGAWNAAGLKFELSAFADHTVHFSESRISEYFSHLPLRIISQTSTVTQTRAMQRKAGAYNADALLKKVFFKNALIEVVAVRQ